jgi:bla regulator protein blaR1
MDTLAAVVDTLFARLAWTTAQATLLIGALWLLGRLVPRLAPAMRCMLWWLVAAQLLLGVLVSTPVSLRWLKPAVESASPTHHVVVVNTSSDATTTTITTQAPQEIHSSSTFDLIASSWTWREAILAVWLLVIAAQLYFVIRQWRESRTLLRHAKPIQDESLRRLGTQQARALGLRHCPQLLLSDAITSPQVTGMWRPVVLFPSNHSLNDDESSMALAHELAHIRRGDLWLGWVPAIAQRLFFFHPLVHWAMCEYALNREAACDAHVLKQPQLEPRDYGRLLLRLGVSSPMHSSLAGASPTFANLKRRMIMLQQTSTTPSRARGWIWVAAIALIGILPYRLTAADPAHVAIIQDAGSAVFTPAPPPPPAPPPKASATVSPAQSAIPPIPPPPPPPPAPIAPAPAAPEQAARPPAAPSYTSKHMDVDIDSNATRGFALFDGDTLIINGNDADSRAAYRSYKPPTPMLWYRSGGKSYVVHDSNIIQQARDTYSEVTDLAQEQGQLAGRQGALAGEQAGLAARTSALAGRESEVAGRRSALIARQEALQDSRETSDEKAADESSLKGQLKGLDAEDSEIKREYQDLDSQQKGLSEQQEALSREMKALSEKQKETSDKVDARMSKLLDEAKARGVAEAADL